MPYRTTPLSAGCHYHLYNRGNNREPIFFERENYLFFLREIRKHLGPHTDVIAYVLMPNHYHLLIHLNSDGLSEAMRTLTISYTKAVNKRYDRVGTLFQGRYQSILVDKDEYLVHLSRYIHLNPLKAQLVAKAEDWEFSSYPDYVGLRKGTLLRPDIVLSQFPAPSAYRHYVEDMNADEHPVEQLAMDYEPGGKKPDFSVTR